VRADGIVARVPSPSDPAAELSRALAELRALHASVERLTAENASLHARLERSDAARTDLFAQARHLLELLAESRREVWSLQSQPRG
jgi:hypothetical protein